MNPAAAASAAKVMPTPMAVGVGGRATGGSEVHVTGPGPGGPHPVLPTLAASDETPPLQEVEDALVRLVTGFVAAP